MNDGTRRPASAGQRKLIVWCDDAEAAGSLVDALRRGFVVDGKDSLSAVGEHLTETPDTGIVLLYLSPVETLCRAMAADTPPSAALATWQTRAEEILRLNRRDRRRVQLLEISTARANPGRFQQHFHLPGTDLPEPPPQDPVLWLMADHAMNKDPQSRRIRSELEAASLDCTDGKQEDMIPDAAFHAYWGICQTYQLKRQEAELLQAQARAAQEELEASTRDKLKLENALETAKQDSQQEIKRLNIDHQRLDQRLAQMRQGMESYQAQLSDLSDERDRFKRRAGEKDRSLAAMGEILQEIEAQRTYLETRLDELRAEREQALQKARTGTAEMQRIMSSKSFRLTAPLRRLRSLISGGGAA